MRLAESGVRQFASRHGITDTELEIFSLKFPSAEVQLDAIVDGYNTTLIDRETGVRLRIHKAWVTVSSQDGRRAQGTGVTQVDVIEGWQVEAPQAADARLAIINAARCATNRFLGADSKDCA